MTPPLSALVSLSAYKGRLTNELATQIVAQALKELNISSKLLPLGDGGLGTLRTVHSVLGGEIYRRWVSHPLGQKVEAECLAIPNAKAPSAVYLESAQACGYHLVNDSERDPMRASSAGLGELILDAAKTWESSLERIYIGLGDSAVSDMGMGMLTALGFSFLDDASRALWPNANSLRQIKTFTSPKDRRLEKIKFTVLCDVLNPVCGPQGSARIFAPQKGASPTQVQLLEQGMENFCAVLQKANGRNLRLEPMTGAAGGLAAACLGFLNAELVLGARFVMDWIRFDDQLRPHDFLIVGEGKTDKQTLCGKAPWEAIERGRKLGKKVILISGALGEGHEQLVKQNPLLQCFACGEHPSAQEALHRRTLEVFQWCHQESHQPNGP